MSLHFAAIASEYLPPGHMLHAVALLLLEYFPPGHAAQLGEPRRGEAVDKTEVADRAAIAVDPTHTNAHCKLGIEDEHKDISGARQPTGRRSTSTRRTPMRSATCATCSRVSARTSTMQRRPDARQRPRCSWSTATGVAQLVRRDRGPLPPVG